MHRVKEHALILAAAAVGVCVSFEALTALAPGRVASPASVFVAPQGPTPETPAASALKPLPASGAQAQYTRVLLSPADREALAREIQRELQRVGCYRGEADGTWGPQSRQAMGALTATLKLRIPFDTPDEMLLRLVQGQAQKVCGGPDLDPEQAANFSTAVPPPRLVQQPTEVKRASKRPPAAETRAPPEPAPPPETRIAESAPSRRVDRALPGPPPAPQPAIVRNLMQTVTGVLGPLGF